MVEAIPNQEENQAQSSPNKINRRDFLKWVGRGGLTLGTLFLFGGGTDRQERQLSLQISNKEKPVSILPDTPDGHISMVDDNFWLMSGTETKLVTGNLEDSKLMETQTVLSPQRQMTEYGWAGYAGISCVLADKGAGKLWGFTHEEHWPDAQTYFPFAAHIGLVSSTDNGHTWQKHDLAIGGQAGLIKPDINSGEVRGAGQPAAIIKDNEVWLYYVDWNGRSPDAIHLAKAPLDQIDNPQAWQGYNQGSFVEASQKSSQAVISPQERDGYAALPSISFNRALNKFLAIFETNLGFKVATSENGIDWEHRGYLAQFPQARSDTKSGDTWYSYPTFLTPSTRNHTLTGFDGFLYYSKGDWAEGSHRMFRRAVSFV